MENFHNVHVSVWYANLDLKRPNDPLDTIELSVDELRRARGLKLTLVRRRWIRSRQFLRLVLSKYFRTTPSAINYVRTAKGKPSVLCASCDSTPQGGRRPYFYFNNSHSGPWAAIVVADGKVGVDLEFLNERCVTVDDVQSAFTVNELLRLRSMSDEARLRAVYSIWTAKEALMKALGEGLWLEPHLIDVSFDEYGHPVGYSSHPDFLLKTQWLTTHVVASVATLGLTMRPRFRNWFSKIIPT